MPFISIEGPIFKDIAKKRELAKELTDAAIKAYDLPRESIVVIIRENLPENVGVGGTLVIDRKKPSDTAK